MHGSVAQLNPGIVSLLEGLGRQGQGPLHELLTNVIYTHRFFSGFYFQTCARVRGYFHSTQRHSVHIGLHKRSQNRSKCNVTAAVVAQCDAIYCSSCALFVRPVKFHLGTIVDQIKEKKANTMLKLLQKQVLRTSNYFALVEAEP